MDLGLLDRFWKKVRKTKTCWFWTAAGNGTGYGIFRSGVGRDKYKSSKWILAHRMSLKIHGIKIPKKMVIDHLCKNKMCVNPKHLEIVTQKENTLRGESPPAKQARRTRCIRGHLFDKISCKKRRCSICDKAKERRRSLKRKSCVKNFP